MRKIFVLFLFPAVLKKWISMQKLAQIYMHSWRQRCKIDNFVFDISIHPNMRMLENIWRIPAPQKF